MINKFRNIRHKLATQKKVGACMRCAFGGILLMMNRALIVLQVTKKANANVEIFIKNKSSGITEGIKDKILQPFFTTKPSGEGTGLGLSLSYDIITKGHGGEIKVESKEEQGTEFTIVLPV